MDRWEDGFGGGLGRQRRRRAHGGSGQGNQEQAQQERCQCTAWHGTQRAQRTCVVGQQVQQVLVCLTLHRDVDRGCAAHSTRISAACSNRSRRRAARHASFGLCSAREQSQSTQSRQRWVGGLAAPHQKSRAAGMEQGPRPPPQTQTPAPPRSHAAQSPCPEPRRCGRRKGEENET